MEIPEVNLKNISKKLKYVDIVTNMEVCEVDYSDEQEFEATNIQCAPNKTTVENYTKNDKTDIELLMKEEEFYGNAKKYWSSIAPTIDGMLGGFGNISIIDIRSSTEFLQEIFKTKPMPDNKAALDCGGGIGRVTKYLLLPLFEQVDIVEQNKKFTDIAREFVGNNSKLGIIFNEGLQDFTPLIGKYDIIWSQWVLGHLNNDDLVKFLQRCGKALKKNGMIVIKENVSSQTVDMDKTDSSVTRPLFMLKALIVKSGMRIVKIVRQHNFPKDLFAVYMIALKPARKYTNN